MGCSVVKGGLLAASSSSTKPKDKLDGVVQVFDILILGCSNNWRARYKALCGWIALLRWGCVELEGVWACSLFKLITVKPEKKDKTFLTAEAVCSTQCFWVHCMGFCPEQAEANRSSFPAYPWAPVGEGKDGFPFRRDERKPLFPKHQKTPGRTQTKPHRCR